MTTFIFDGRRFYRNDSSFRLIICVSKFNFFNILLNRYPAFRSHLIWTSYLLNSNTALSNHLSDSKCLRQLGSLPMLEASLASSVRNTMTQLPRNNWVDNFPIPQWIRVQTCMSPSQSISNFLLPFQPTFTASESEIHCFNEPVLPTQFQ